MSESVPITREAIRAMRLSYGQAGLSESEVSNDPIELFKSWLTQAAGNEYIVEANAMVLATVNQGIPTSRTVLLKDVSNIGFSFFTNYESRKADAIESNKNVSLVFPWYPMERQVIVLGTAQKVSVEESDSYFAERPWGSQIGAWASAQSRVLKSREDLENSFKEFSEKYPEGSTVPRPAHWGGYIVQPSSVEFWQGRYSRLHDRLRFTREVNADSDVSKSTDWQLTRLNP